MTKRSIELKKQYVGFDSFYEAKAIQEEATRVREEASQLDGCDGVRFSIEKDYYEDDIRMCWVFYRLETDEEEAYREKRDKVYSDAYKKRQYEQLKKELGL